MKSWDEWSDEKGMEKEMGQALIKSAAAQQTYKACCISEKELPFSDILLVENLKTGKILFRKYSYR